MKRLLTAAISSLFPAVLIVWMFQTWRPRLQPRSARTYLAVLYFTSSCVHFWLPLSPEPGCESLGLRVPKRDMESRMEFFRSHRRLLGS